MLPTRPLGNTGIPVTVLGFGGAPLGDLFERLDEGTGIATVESRGPASRRRAGPGKGAAPED